MNINYSKSLLISVVSKVFLSLSAFIALWLITNNFSKEIVGQYSLTLSIVNIFYMLARFGLPELLLYESSKNRDTDKLIKHILFISIIISFCFMVLLIITSGIISALLKSDISVNLIYFSLSVLFMPIVDVFVKWYQVKQNIPMSLIPSNIIRPLLFILFLLLYFYFFEHRNFCIIAYSFTASYIVVAIVYMINLRKCPCPQSFAIDYSHAYNNILNSFLVSFILSMDTFLVSYFYTDVEVAVYQVAIKMIVVTTLYGMVIDPIFTSRLIVCIKNRDISLLESEYKKISIMGLIFWIFIFLFFIIFKDPIFSSFGDYKDSIKIFFILMLGRLFDCTFGFAPSILNNFGYSKIILINTAFTICIIFILNLIFIKFMSYESIAYATSAAFIIQSILRNYQIKKYAGIDTGIMMTVVASIALIVIVYVLKVF